MSISYINLFSPWTSMHASEANKTLQMSGCRNQKVTTDMQITFSLASTSDFLHCMQVFSTSMIVMIKSGKTTFNIKFLWNISKAFIFFKSSLIFLYKSVELVPAFTSRSASLKNASNMLTFACIYADDCNKHLNLMNSDKKALSVWRPSVMVISTETQLYWIERIEVTTTKWFIISFS